MQMFSEFDAFTGALLKAIYIKNEDLLKGISREITLRELFDYQSIDDIKRSMLEKEIETFRRDSYIDQFSSLEKKFQIQLKKFDEYPEFIELSQRRNIFVHNDGLVSDQYLWCEREGWKFPKRPAAGDASMSKWSISGEHFALCQRLGLHAGPHTVGEGLPQGARATA